MTPPPTFTAPGNAAQAAEQLSDLLAKLEQARTYARSYGTAADKAEHLYRREKAKAAIVVDGPNADVRDGLIHQHKLDGEARQESAQVAEAMGLSAGSADTVGELRWLRDRAGRLAGEWSATAYDRRAAVGAWQTVVALVRSEAELAGVGT